MQMGLFDKFKNVFSKKEIVEVESYEKGLAKTRNDFVSKLNILNSKYKKVSNEYFDELEEILIMADIGVNTVMDFVDRLKKRVKKENIVDSKDLLEIIVDEMFIIYVNNDVIVNKINYSNDGPTVILFVGVNGVGKTTTIGKLAYKLVNEGKKVLMVAGDTFRAGAVSKLMSGERDAVVLLFLILLKILLVLYMMVLIKQRKKIMMLCLLILLEGYKIRTI